MTLQVQLQTLFCSFGFGLGYGFCYGMYNRLVLGIKSRCFFEALFNCLYVWLYFWTMLHINQGIFYGYHGIVFAFGLVYYLLVFSQGYLSFVEKLITWLFLPFSFINKKIHGILFDMKKVRGHGNNKKSK